MSDDRETNEDRPYCVVCGLHPVKYGDVCSMECWADFMEATGANDE